MNHGVNKERTINDLNMALNFKSPDIHHSDQARSAIFEYIEIFYNRKRLHSTLDYLSPVDYEKLNSIN